MSETEKNVIKTDKLGLAAYIKMVSVGDENTKLINVDRGTFEFESEKSLDVWRIEYINSCCYRHDSELCELRKHYSST